MQRSPEPPNPPTAQASHGLQVKGGSIRSKLAFVREAFGPSAEQALLEELEERGVAQVLEASWYEYEHYDAVLRHIADRHFGGDFDRLREVGRYSARLALTTTYEAYLGSGELRGFLSRISKLHGRYYSRGSLSVLALREGLCRLRLHGAGFYREPDLQVAAGFYAGAAELLGCRHVRCRYEIEEDGAAFLLEWDRASPERG